jgi:hypothetical protein
MVGHQQITPLTQIQSCLITYKVSIKLKQTTQPLTFVQRLPNTYQNKVMAKRKEPLPPGSYKSPKRKGVVPASTLSMFDRGTYIPGDGDVKRYMRPGSDHSIYKSFGYFC